MKQNWLLVAAVPLCVAPLLWAQDGKSSAQGQSGSHDGASRPLHNQSRLARVRPEDRDDAREGFDREAWRTKLSQADLEQRERDFERLIDLARRQSDVRDALESWAKDAGSPELSWTSRLALRELERSPRRFGLMHPGAAAPEWSDLQSRFDELQRRFGGMDSMFSDLQSELNELFEGGPMLAPMPGAAGPAPQSSQAESFSLQVGPDGVKCTVTEDKDGEKHTREYTAESLDALLEANPELRDKIQVGGLGGAWGFGPGSGHGLFRMQPGDPSVRPFSGAPPTDRLGIRCTKLPPERLKELGLEPERGVYVESIQAGTIAQILGIRRGDLIIDVNGTEIYGAEDVTRVLRERRQDEPIAVVLIDGKGQRRTLTWNPEEKSEGSASQKDEPSRKF